MKLETFALTGSLLLAGLLVPCAAATQTLGTQADERNDSPCFWWYRPDLEVTACFNRFPPGPFCLRIEGVVDDCWDPLGP